MERFTKLFGSLIVFVYHCFDRVVIHGYLSGLSRPEQVLYFFRQVLGIPVVSQEVLRQRSDDYRCWVEAYARNHKVAMEWAEKGVRKEDRVLPALRLMEKKNAFGVYFIFKSMEQGRTFRIGVPKYPTADPNYRILAHQRSRFTHYYFYVRDEVLGPIILRVASFFPFHATYWLNGHSFMEQELKRNHVGFRKNDNTFLAVDDVAALQAAATPTISPPKACRSRCCFCSFTSDSAARWPTAASITNPTRKADRTANWKPPTTRPTRPLRTSLTCYKPPDVTSRLLNYFCRLVSKICG